VRPEPAGPAAVRVLAIADTDSYLKWSAATLDALPHSWESSQVLIHNPVMPSQAQIRAATGRPVEVMSHTALVRRIRRTCPDLVLLACTGPVVATLTANPSSGAATDPYWLVVCRESVCRRRTEQWRRGPHVICYWCTASAKSRSSAKLQHGAHPDS
jgi:hypothetical protein